MMQGRRGGVLVVLEGAEGVGKTTQAGRLAAALVEMGRDALVLREPGGTALGERIRDVLLDPSLAPSAAGEALLFLASRAELIAGAVRPALERGTVVILDRFFLSTYAYQVAGRGLPESRVCEANQLAVGGLVPDLTLVLELPRDAGLARVASRGAQDRMEQADAAFHQRVRDAFGGFTRTAWQRAHPECGPIVAIDASGGEQHVAARVMDAVRPVITRPAAAHAMAWEEGRS